MRYGASKTRNHQVIDMGNVTWGDSALSEGDCNKIARNRKRDATCININRPPISEASFIISGTDVRTMKPLK